jgi:hypothetical protein
VAASSETADSFSLLRGGPLFAFERLAHLRRRRGGNDVLRRSLVFIAVGWLPPVVLALLSGTTKGTLWPLHLRYLAALPLMFFAEGFVDRRVREAVEGIAAGDLFAEGESARLRQAFAGYVERGVRLRDSLPAALVIVAVAFALCPFAAVAAKGLTMPSARLWAVLVSLPVVRVEAFFWIWRWIIWTALLARVARLDLRLMPTHPDRVGGLGFLEPATRSFAWVLLAWAIVLFGGLAGQLVLHGGRATAFAPVVAGFGAVVVLALVGPPALFTRALLEAKRTGIQTYGALANVHCRRFADAWLGQPGGAPLGDPSVSSLADLLHSVGSIEEMRPIPFGRTSLILLGLLIVAPVVPLALTQMPLPEVARRLFELLLA